MSAPGPIDRAWLRAHAGGKFLVHVDCSDRSFSSFDVIDKRTGARIGLGYEDISWRRNKRNGARAGTSERQWFVDEHPGPIATLDEALSVLNSSRSVMAEPA